MTSAACRPRALLLALVAGVSVACAGGAGEGEGESDALAADFIVDVVAFDEGAGAGFGQDRMPNIILGPPQGSDTRSTGSLDVLSLGKGGVIIVELGKDIVDHDGVDFIVFENPFETQLGTIYGEPAEVAVSADGESFTTFTCTPPETSVAVADITPLTPVGGCAGFGLVRSNADNDVDPTDANVAGGDAFDLADVGVVDARFVRIIDKGTSGAGPSAGFDLDAIAIARAQ